jgi:hypothetical protein
MKACKSGRVVTEILLYSCWADSEPVINKKRCCIVGCPLLNTSTNIKIHVLHNLKIKTHKIGGIAMRSKAHIIIEGVGSQTCAVQ